MRSSSHRASRGLHAVALASAWVCVTSSSQAWAQATLPEQRVVDTAVSGATLDLDVPNATGSRLGLTARESPASVSSLSAADSAERGLTRAQDVAIRMPGITQTPSPGNGGTALVARGFSGHNSVAQLVDGTRLVARTGR